MVNWCIELHRPLNQCRASPRDLQAGRGRSCSVHCFTSQFTTSPIHQFTAISSAAAHGTVHGRRYACTSAMPPMNVANSTLCQKVLRSTSPSLPTSPTVETPMAMFCGEIILPATAPEELVAASRTGLRLSCCAAATWRLPNRKLLDVSLPVRKHATQPRKLLTSGKNTPVPASAAPSVYTMPE